MSRHLGLTTRVKRLERRRRSRRPRPAIIFAIEDMGADAVLGLVGAGGGLVERHWGEAMPALAERARAELGGARILLARYAPPLSPGPPVERGERQSAPEPPTSFPWHLAAIGRVATPAELERTGAVPVPP